MTASNASQSVALDAADRSTAAAPPTSRRLLLIYANDHLAAAVATRALARRMRSAGRWRDHGQLLAAVVETATVNVEQIRGYMAEHGLDEQRPKQLLAVAAERAGRLKPNGRIVSTSPLTRMLELDALIVSLVGCRQFWRTVATFGPSEHRARAQVQRLDELLARVERIGPRIASRSFRPVRALVAGIGVRERTTTQSSEGTSTWPTRTSRPSRWRR